MDVVLAYASAERYFIVFVNYSRMPLNSDGEVELRGYNRYRGLK